MPAAVMSSTGMRTRAGTQVWPGHGSSGGMLDRRWMAAFDHACT
jgi:hypothetical protein